MAPAQRATPNRNRAIRFPHPVGTEEETIAHAPNKNRAKTKRKVFIRNLLVNYLPIAHAPCARGVALIRQASLTYQCHPPNTLGHVLFPPSNGMYLTARTTLRIQLVYRRIVLFVIHTFERFKRIVKVHVSLRDDTYYHIIGLMSMSIDTC